MNVFAILQAENLRILVSFCVAIFQRENAIFWLLDLFLARFWFLHLQNVCCNVAATLLSLNESCVTNTRQSMTCHAVSELKA